MTLRTLVLFETNADFPPRFCATYRNAQIPAHFDKFALLWKGLIIKKKEKKEEEVVF